MASTPRKDLRPNELLDQMMRDSGSPQQPYRPRSQRDLRPNDLLDQIMGGGTKALQKRDQSKEGIDPTQKYPLVPYRPPQIIVPPQPPGNQGPPHLLPHNQSNLAKRPTQIIQAPPLQGNSGGGGFNDCCDELVALLGQLVDVAVDIFAAMKASNSSGGPPGKPPPTPKKSKEWEPERDWLTKSINWVNQSIQKLWDPKELIEEGEEEAKKGERVQSIFSTFSPMGLYGKGKEFIGRGKQAIGHGLSGFGQIAQGRELSGGGSLLSGAGALAGNVPLIGKPVEAFAKLADTVLKSVDQLRVWNEMMRSNNFRFSEFSAGMAQVQGESEARRIEMMQRQGDLRAPWARMAEESGDRLENEMGKIASAFGTVANMGKSLISNLVTDISEKLKIGEAAEKINKSLNQLIEDKNDFGELDHLSDWDYAQTILHEQKVNRNRPIRFRDVVGKIRDAFN